MNQDTRRSLTTLVLVFGIGTTPAAADDPPWRDCNGNEIDDREDIASGFSQDCNGNLVPDECDLAFGFSIDECPPNSIPDECEDRPVPPAATILRARSYQPGRGSLPLTPGVRSEPRHGGVGHVVIEFDTALDFFAGWCGTPMVSLEEATCPTGREDYRAYSGNSTIDAAVTNGPAGPLHVLLLSFTPSLENGRTYRINIAPEVTSVPGQLAEVRGLLGDVNSDGSVNASDRSAVVGVWVGSGFSTETDLNGDRRTDAADRSLVVGAWTSAETCAP